jgi:hypothetical protein
MNKIISCSVPSKLLRIIDGMRGDVPRSKYIVRQLESTLSKCNVEKSSAGKSCEPTNQQNDVGEH